jgi:hypothetical protein
MSPAWPSEKPRRRTSSSPVSPAWKVTPAVVRSTSRKSSWLRSAISFSVNTVTDWGMSRMSCLPLPTVVFFTRTVSLLWISAVSFTVTVDSVAAVSAVCAQLPMEAASISAPRGTSALSAAVVGVCKSVAGRCCVCFFAKVASVGWKWDARGSGLAKAWLCGVAHKDVKSNDSHYYSY